MSDRTQSGKVDMLVLADEARWYDSNQFTGQIYRMELLGRLSTGKIDQAQLGTSVPIFEGVSDQDALASASERLKVIRKGCFRITVAASDAAADLAKAFRVKGSGSGNALVLADRGRSLYAEDSRTLTVAPSDPTAPLCGYVSEVTTIGTSADGEGYAILDADWALAMVSSADDDIGDQVIGIQSRDFRGLIDTGNFFSFADQFHKLPALNADTTLIADSSGGTASAAIAAGTNIDTIGGSLTGTLDNTLADIGDTTMADGSATINKNFKEIQAELVTQRALNTVLLNAVASLAKALNGAIGKNLQWEVGGTNMTTALVTRAAGGGITLTTAGADNDQAYIRAHQDSGVSVLESIAFSTAKGLRVTWTVETGASVAAILLWAGLKIDETDPTVATDADQAFFRFSTDDSDTNWECVHSISGTDDTDDSGIALAVSTVYRLAVDIDANRVPRFYINDVLVATGGALTSVTTLKPVCGVQALTGAAKAITIRSVSISQSHN